MLRTLFLALVGLLFLTPWLAAQVDKPKLVSAKPLPTEGVKDELKKLQIERYNAALTVMQARWADYQVGKGTVDYALEAATLAGKARLELLDQPADRLDCLEQILEVCKALEKYTQSKLDAGRESTVNLAQAKYRRLDAEIELLKAKKEMKDKKK